MAAAAANSKSSCAWETRTAGQAWPSLLARQLRIPTARDATSAIVASEIADSAIISSLARTVRGNVSAGENAVAFVRSEEHTSELQSPQ